jgi:hypothetical protein
LGDHDVDFAAIDERAIGLDDDTLGLLRTDAKGEGDEKCNRQSDLEEAGRG